MGVVKQLILTNLLLCFLRLSVCHENISYLKVQNLNTQKVALKGDHIRPYFSNIKFLPVNLSHANQDTKDVNNNIEDKINFENSDFYTQKDINQEVSSDGTKSSDTSWRDFDDLQTTKDVNNNIEDKISYENADFNTQKDINQEVSSHGTKSSDTSWRDFDDLQTTKDVNNNIEDKISYENADFNTQKDINQEVSSHGTKSSDTGWRDFDDLQTTKDVNNDIEDKINYENADFYAQKDINQEISLDETESSDTSWKDFDDLQTTQIKINDIDSSKEPVEFEVPYETISRFNTQMFEPTTSSLVQKPPRISSTINLKLTEADKDIDIFFRTKKDLRGNPSKRNSRNKNAPTKSNPFSELRRLNQSKRKEILEMMAADASANGTNVDEQQFNKETDSIHILHKHINEKSDDYDSGMNCNFENDCRWTWRKDIANGFFITAGGKLAANESGPRFDANEREFGSFLIIHLPLNSGEFDVKSPLIGPTTHSCKLHMNTWQENMENGEIRVVGDKTIDKYPGANDHTQWLVDTVYGKNRKKWENHVMNIGRISSDFTILLEVVPPKNMSGSATVAFDNLQLYRCFVKSDDICTPTQYRCDGVQLCVNSSAICDINEDCALGDDEKQSCHLIPFGGRCNFEEDEWCGWENTEDSRILKWTRHNGSTPTNFTGPDHDHTYMNKTGNYLYVNMLTDGSGFASGAVLKSKTFNPPPRVHGNSSSRYYNSCALRFYLHKTGKHKSGILVQVTELAPAENITTKLYWNFMDDHGDHWVRQVSILPNITHKYYISFEAKKGFRYISDVAIDDVSLSPECFGLNVPSDELQGYNYWNPAIDITPPKDTHPDFQNKTYYKLSTCQAKGRFGPTHPECQKVYNHTDVSIKVLHEAGLTGVQRWIAPVNSFYTFLIAGASGGKGSSGMGSSRGAMVRTVLNLKKGQEVYILVGQEGNSACPKFLGQAVNSSCYGNRNNYSPGKVREVLLTDINDSGGGGGGATYVFVRNRTKEKVPIAIAAGGGGLGLARSVDGENHQGQAINMSVQPTGGNTWGYKSSGPGGGWISVPGELHTPMSGLSLLSGGIGGKACYNSTDGRGDGGFGGGGGGCKNGGGGGGYRGGDANSTNGDGGISYLDPNRGVPNLAEAHSGYNAGPGYAVIIPAVEGCDCMYMCVALDERRSKVSCVCPGNWKLAEDKKSCTPGVLQVDADYPVWFIGILIGTVICLTLAFCTFCFFLYNRYQARHSGIMRRKMIPGPDFQLDRLRLSSDNMMTEYNPNYEWAGSVYTVKDLKEIPREQLRLIKALGQGAFGEVYQGCYRQRPGDTLELAVAVKTLPEMSTNQAEMDFLMEALIMSKFNHPNIVHFIGVCFDKHPRFIVLELLGGGDLKNFLRECRPKPERSSPLRMKDLVLISIDIAKGCNYLEENRFIHRDIAARNCLLTTKGPGRVVKIADFGMSRDVYRSDYYRKGGKAMLPIKWMPPEAFLDGIFTSKTDVWSFGVLLWEIFRMGFMPYTGCTNKEVMDLVVQGGRLEQPENCPGPIFGIMRQCWHPNPEDRPTFALILERLGYCAQDPEIMSSQLPIFQMVPPSETDTTIMRPSDSEEILKVVANPDYLLPNEAILTTPDVMESTSSVEKLLPEKDNWETPFILPSSKSTQPLLIDNVRGDEENKNVENSSTTKTTPIQNSIPHNNNFMLRNDATVKSGVALDASVLAKNVMGVNAVKKYANINQDGNVALSNGIISNRSRNNYVKNEEETTY